VNAQVTSPFPGFAVARHAAQREIEQRFLAAVSSRTAEAAVRELSARPHLSGTPGAAATAEWLAAELRRLGFDVEVEEYEPWLPHPGRAAVTVVHPEQRALVLREPRPQHAPAALRADAPELASWHAYAGNGSAEGEVVYANYGLPEDYAALARLGIDVRGRIVLARLGRSYRGVKVEQAEQRGAAAVLLFPDPSGDGWAAGDTLPLGPYRPADSVQRGTVAYMWRYTGDPLTPGVAARPGVPRLEPAQATDLPRIPAVPLSYAAAGRLLAALAGPEPPASFRGALAVGYRPGPGPLRVRVEVEQEYALRPIRNVIARLRGRTAQHVIIGNHYDAWVLGGVDPHTGTAATLEIARGVSALAGSGWRPRRGITLAFWDAEEYGVIGSTEWVEDHAAELKRNAVAYFNVDVFTAGTLDVSGAHALRDAVVAAADAVRDPTSGRTLGAAWRERQARARPNAGNGFGQPLLSEIGAGSDWTAFLHFAGVPSLQWTMNGRGTYAVYHSVLDDFEYYRRFADSAFVHTPAFAAAMGLAALRLADADALPFRYSHYAERIQSNLRALERAHDIALPRRTNERVAALRVQAEAFEGAQHQALVRGDTVALAAADTLLPRVEQAFLDPDGLPGRPWYRHQLSAPGADTGYDPLPFAPVVEALRAGDRTALERALARLDAALERAAAVLDAATRALEPKSDRAGGAGRAGTGAGSAGDSYVYVRPGG
jgi:N-acetylated-alpha-linked acidic dipeptidase